MEPLLQGRQRLSGMDQRRGIGVLRLWAAPQLLAAQEVTEQTGSPRRTSRGSRERGATIPEFALVFLLYFMLVVGLMELGRGIWTYSTLAFAARQGVRYAMIHGNMNPVSDAQIESVVESNAIGLGPEDLTVTPSWQPDKERGSIVEVQVRYPFRLVVSPLILSQDTIPMASTARRVIVR